MSINWFAHRNLWWCFKRVPIHTYLYYSLLKLLKNGLGYVWILQQVKKSGCTVSITAMQQWKSVFFLSSVSIFQRKNSILPFTIQHIVNIKFYSPCLFSNLSTLNPFGFMLIAVTSLLHTNYIPIKYCLYFVGWSFFNMHPSFRNNFITRHYFGTCTLVHTHS